MYDLANQSFQLLINTLLFSLYYTQVIAPDPKTGERHWGFMAAASMLLVMLVSPVLGALADARAWKREVLLTTGIACSILTASLALLGQGQVWGAVLLFIPASLLCGIGENFLGSFLPEISTPQTIGRISALGFVMSYTGALLLLGITAAAVYLMGWKDPSQWRWLFVFAAAWFLAGIVPAFYHLHERAQRDPSAGTRTAAGAALGRIGQTIRDAGRHRQLLGLLGIAIIYQMGYMTVIYFASVIAKNQGAKVGTTLVLALIMTVSAGVAAAVVSRAQDRLGHRTTIIASLAVWAVSTLVLAAGIALNADNRLFWGVAVGWGLGLGSIGTATRAAVGAFTPRHKSAEFFGLYGMTYRLATVVGVPLFGVVSTQAGQTSALLMLAAFFGVGVALMFVIDDRRGVQEARDAEARHASTLPA
jgi:MFS transporter, UMF1 family